MTSSTAVAGTGSYPAIDPLMRPTSVAIIGMSSREGTPSRTVLGNLRRNDYRGDIYLVGKGGFDVDGLPCLAGIEELPEGVDLAVLVIGAEAVAETIERLIARKVRSAICFASGFAETGDAGRAEQDRIGQIARDGGLALIGPNCVGYTNYLDGFSIMLVEMGRIPSLTALDGGAVGIVAQSGGIGAHLSASLLSRAVPVSYLMTTGNEASMGLADLADYYVADADTRTILVYAEQIREPSALLRAAANARAAGKTMVMLHPGKSATARAATASHTGALAGDYEAMRVALEAGGILMADTLEEAVDLAELALRCPLPPSRGLGLVTASGALCALAQDYCEGLGQPVPPLSQAQVDALASHLPDYTPPRNPLDLGTLAAWKPELLGLGVQAMLDDPAMGSVLISFPYGEAALAVPWIKEIVAASSGAAKPVVYCVHDEGVPLPAEVEAAARAHRLILSRSPERAMRTLAAFERHAERLRGSAAAAAQQALPPIAWPAGSGAMAEVAGKAILRSVGIPVPAGDLARSADDAVGIAGRIGYPVAIKIQSADILHKSDVGGVILGIADEAALRRAWQQMDDAVRRNAPQASIEGILVERMSQRGLELVIGARRDPSWGASVLVGLGGVWIEALGDVRLLPATASRQAFKAALLSLRGARLMQGFRGDPPVDLDAVADVAEKLAVLMTQYPQISEIDLNPVVAYPAGAGCMVLDALIVREQVA